MVICPDPASDFFSDAQRTIPLPERWIVPCAPFFPLCFYWTRQIFGVSCVFHGGTRRITETHGK
jgi:hypothetical protein